MTRRAWAQYENRRVAHQDAACHEGEADDGPEHAPAGGGATVPLGEDAGVALVDFTEDEIVEAASGRVSG